MTTPATVQRGPVEIEEAILRFPTLRQSLMARFDDCALSAFFELEYARGWNTHPQARGTIFHRFAAECLRTMKRYKHRTIPVSEALEILIEVCRQRDVPPEEIVRVPLRQMPELRMAAIKFAKDNEFSVERITDIEQRLQHELTYELPDGRKVRRLLSGTLDALIYDPPDGAIVIDWKDTWGLPPEPRDAPVEPEDELKGISYHGYFQQRFYGWLVMMSYPNVQRVTLREFYARKTKVRKATLHRAQLDVVEDELRVLVEAWDRAVMAGAPSKPYGVFEVAGERVLDIERMGFWKPQPGKHCGFCVKKGDCPIEDEARGVGAIRTPAMAARYAAEMVVAEEVREDRREACKTWVETTGEPIPVKFSKGRRVLGWQTTRRGRRFDFFTPDESDRGGHPADKLLASAMRDAAARARTERPPRRRKSPA